MARNSTKIFWKLQNGLNLNHEYLVLEQTATDGRVRSISAFSENVLFVPIRYDFTFSCRLFNLHLFLKTTYIIYNLISLRWIFTEWSSCILHWFVNFSLSDVDIYNPKKNKHKSVDLDSVPEYNSCLLPSSINCSELRLLVCMFLKCSLLIYISQTITLCSRVDAILQNINTFAYR